MAVVRPGDTLLVMFERNLSGEAAEGFAANLRQHLDPAVKLIILDGFGDCTIAPLLTEIPQPGQENIL
jgi:hypothetical protein